MPKISPLFPAMLLCVALAAVSNAQTVRQPAITRTVDPGNSVVLPGSKHQLVQPRFDVGAVNPGLKMNRVIVMLAAPQPVEDELQSFLGRQQDKTSADYHHWLTPDEFGQRFGAAPQDIATVKSWLEQQGIQVTAVARSGRWMEVSGTSGQIERTFQTQMRQFQINGKTHIANATDISIPAALTPIVRGVVSLNDFHKKPLTSKPVMVKANTDGTYSAITPNATSTTGVHALSPGDYAKIYDITPVYNGNVTGTGIKIGLVARSNISTGDYNGFRSVMNLPVNNVNTVLTQEPDPGFDPNNGDSVEATLDAQWAGAVAPGASISVIISASTSTTDGVDLSSAYAVDHNLVDVLSVSFGECEVDLGSAENAFYNSMWQQATAQGMSVFVSTGDDGAAGCDDPNQPGAATGGIGVSGVASTSFNTAVGGTQLAEGAASSTYWTATNALGLVSANGYIPEAVWNESCNPSTPGVTCPGNVVSIFAGSGGQSIIYSKPIWQTGFPATADTSRDIPDVSLTAAIHDGYLVCFNGSCPNGFSLIGGTSASSPSFAGIMALVDQSLGGRQGLANYALYRLAKGASASCSSSARTNPAAPAPAGCIFNDITAGNNSVPGQAGFNATSGYDLASGLGSVNVATLISAWKLLSSAATTTTLTSNGGTSITSAHGTIVPLTINVTGPAAPAPSGGVALVSSLTGIVGSVSLTAPANSATGTFTGNLNILPGGAYFLTAQYAGDSLTAPSVSDPITVTITSEPSTTGLVAFGLTAQGNLIQATSFPYGSFMNLQAIVNGASGHGAVTGFMDFKDSNTVFSSRQVNIVNNEAELFFLPGNPNPVPLTPGPHTLVASYEGDQSFKASASAGVNVTITKGNPGVAVVPPAIFVATQTTSLSAVVNTTGPIAATGTMQFFDSGVALGNPVAVTGSNAILTTTVAAEGQHSISANYSGDNTYNAAVSAAVQLNVVAPFAFTGNALSATVAAGQNAIYNLVVNTPNSPSTFAGTVALTCSGAPAGTTCSINPSSVTFPANNNIVPITVTVATTTSAAAHPLPFRGLPVVFAGVLALAVSLKGNRKRLLIISMGAALALGISSCGGGGSKTVTTLPIQGNTNATVVVTGTSGTHTTTVNLQLTITH